MQGDTDHCTTNWQRSTLGKGCLNTGRVGGAKWSDSTPAITVWVEAAFGEEHQQFKIQRKNE